MEIRQNKRKRGKTMKKKDRKLVTAMVFGGVLGVMFATGGVFDGAPKSCGTVQAATPRLNKRKAAVKMGGKVTLKVSAPTSKVKWKVNKRKVLKIEKIRGPKKNTVVLRGLRKGKAVVTARVGGRKLRSTITVKHTHACTIPATCTEPARCVCGKTYGMPAGHSYSTATCQTPATCVRCGATTGGVSAHNFDASTRRCVWCNIHNLPELIHFSLSGTALDGEDWYNTTSIALVISNNGFEPFVVDATSPGVMVPASGAAPINLFPVNRSGVAYIDVAVLPAFTSNRVLWWHTMNSSTRFTFTPQGTLSFNAKYDGINYRITIKIDGTYTFVRI